MYLRTWVTWNAAGMKRNYSCHRTAENLSFCILYAVSRREGRDVVQYDQNIYFKNFQSPSSADKWL
jgi:hypothetical protein